MGQGTEDYFAESSALVLQTLSLEWSADAEILDAKLLPSEKAEFLSLLERRINERVPTSYLLNLAYFFNKPFYVDERVLIPRSPIAEVIEQRFAPYCLDENGQMREALNNLPENPDAKHFTVEGPKFEKTEISKKEGNTLETEVLYLKGDSKPNKKDLI